MVAGRTDEEAREGARGAAKPRLLIVDDLEDNRIILTRRFARRGYEVEEACGGTEALARIARGGVDLVLLDIVMPDLDGFEVLARIRAEHDAFALPVIMITVRDGAEDVVRALKLGANDYVAKPVDFEVALARVGAQLERRQAFRQAAGQARRALLADMSQEFRPPLNGILGLAKATAQGVSPDPRRDAAQIARSAAALDRLVLDALDRAGVEVGEP